MQLMYIIGGVQCISVYQHLSCMVSGHPMEYCSCFLPLVILFHIRIYNCRAASVSERSEANDRVPFKISLCIYIDVRTLCKRVQQVRKLFGPGNGRQRARRAEIVRGYLCTTSGVSIIYRDE